MIKREKYRKCVSMTEFKQKIGRDNSFIDEEIRN